MSFSDIFIRRPVLSTVVALMILLLGFQGLFNLSVRQYPKVEETVITITTVYPGASADLIQGFITAPIAAAVATTENIDYVTSQSRPSSSTVTVQMELGSNPDTALTEVMSKVQQVRGQLPSDAKDPTIVKGTGQQFAIMYLAMQNPNMSSEELTEYIQRVIRPRMSTIEGVAEVQVLGAANYSMRVWVDPVKLAARGLTAAEVLQAINASNFLSAPGKTKNEYVAYSITMKSTLQTPESFGELPLKSDNGNVVRLRDVAHVELAAESTDTVVNFNGQPGTFIGIFPTPSANPLNTAASVINELPAISASLPQGMTITMVYDSTETISASIEEVFKTIAEAVAIVIVVILLFLGSFRSVLMPVVTIPLSLIGVCFILLMMGYSINLLSLLAMVLAIGLVVDDAIVVVENIHRHIENGKSPFQGAIEGAREIAVPVVTMTITLAAVYAPIGFLSGLTGALFKEFAFTLAGAVIISGVVALTLSPMMCSRLLRHDENPSGLAHRLDLLFEGLKRRYQRSLHATLDNRPVVLVFGALVLAIIPLLLVFTHKELAPEEDQGIVFLMANAPQTANLDYLNKYTSEYERIFRSFPEYYSAFQINGYNGVQSGIGGMLLKPWDERERSQMELLHAVQAELDKIPGLQIFGFNLPSLPGTGEGLPFQFVINTAADYESLLQVAERVKKRAEESGKFAFLDLDLAFDKPELVVDIDRAKAAQMGVSMQDLGITLASLLGEGEINRFTIDGRSYKVIAQVERRFRENPEWLGSYYVKNGRGELLPLSTVVTLHERARPRQLNQFQQLNSAIISGVPLVSMGDAIDSVKQIAEQESPRGFAFDYAGASRQFVQEGNALLLTFGLALAVIFLVLAAQFESFRDPLVIMVTVPLSICGALVPLFLGLSSLNIYTQVGLVTLIGLISKHGILIVEFANQLRRERGLGVREAVEEAAAIRLRPVLMTTAAMVLGVIPLLLATGAGAVSRFDIGVVIATGMTVGTLFTLFVLPCVYTLVAKKDLTPEGDPSPAH